MLCLHFFIACSFHDHHRIIDINDPDSYMQFYAKYQHNHNKNLQKTLPNQQLPLIPYPNNLEMKSGFFKLNSNTRFYTNLPKDEKNLFIRYISSEDIPFMQSSHQLSSNCLNLIVDNNFQINEEGYHLEISTETILIKARTSQGLFYGLQTLMQLIQLNQHGNSLPCLVIDDEPAFKYRGFMIDVSRMWFDKEFILKQLDMLSHFKINRFHFHLTDGGGWRIEIKKYPQLTEKTAYRATFLYDDWYFHSDKHFCSKDHPNAYGGFYTQEDIKEIVKYAADRFITIIPEIEMPSHSDEVLDVFPNLACFGRPYESVDLCVGNNETFVFLQNVLDEIIELFPSEYIHIGGDEASMEQWKICPRCQALMRKMNMKDVSELQSYLIKRIEKYLESKNRKLIGWDEILKGGLAPHATVMSWTGEQGGIDAAKAGHNVVMTPQDSCYLDHYQDLPFTQPKAFGGYTPLRDIYEYHPVPQSLSEDERKYIIGVQASLWTRFLYSPEYAEYMTYPRVLAMAEVGWTRREIKNYDMFSDRVARMNEFMELKGYHPYRNDLSIGDRQESILPVDHLARDKNVKYNIKYDWHYPGTGDKALTDGKRGNWMYFDGVWQGFKFDVSNVYSFDAEIDLMKVKPIKSISCQCMNNQEAKIYVPEVMTIQISNDGVNYTTLVEKKYEWHDSPIYGFETREWTGETSARFVRIQFTGFSGKKDWLFIDEIVIR